MSTVNESQLGASNNGDLINRVQQLRLDSQLGTGSGKSSSRGAILPWVLCGLMAISWAGVGVRWYKTSANTMRQPDEKVGTLRPGTGGTGDNTPNATNPPTTGGSTPTAEPGAIITQLKGTVIPSLQVTVSPRDVAAEITEIYFAEGKRVRKGDKLATLLDAQYANRLNTEAAAVISAKAQVARTQAAHTSANAKVAKAESALAAAEARGTRSIAIQVRANKDFDQAKQQRMSGAISPQDYQRFEADKLAADADKIAADADIEAAKREIDAAKADVKTALANIDAARADVTAADTRFTEAKRLVDNCVVTAPIDGTILTKSADKGALVSPMSFNVAAGICLIADLSKLEVEIDVPERQIMKLKPGLDCLLQADADPNRGYRGVVDRIMPIADDTKNVVKVRIRVYLPKGEDQGAFLKPKMSITATVYNRPFELKPATDLVWGDESAKK